MTFYELFICSVRHRLGGVFRVCGKSDPVAKADEERTCGITDPLIKMTLEKILDYRTIAVVGISDNPQRPSHYVADFLDKHGYVIIPVNPNLTDWKGKPCYSDLLSIPQQVDVVDIFRRPEAVPPIVDEAIAIQAKAVWMQEGIVHEEAAAKARNAGIEVVMDRCMMKEYRRLKG